jgi:hypothetical protein
MSVATRSVFTTHLAPGSHEQHARAIKAIKVAHHLHEMGVTPEEAARMPESERLLHASYAGTRALSDTSWGVAVLFLRDYTEADA